MSAGGAGTPRRKIVVSAGTYHLPFERLSEWTARWVSAHPDVDVVLQHGPSAPVAGAQNHAILPYDALLTACRSADVVVLQGGAGGVMDMRALGIVPIVVPRVPGAGEVVDDHQLVFTAEMERLGLIERALDYDSFTALLASRIAGDRVPAEMGGVETPGIATVRALLDRPLRPLPWTLRLRRLVHSARGIFGPRISGLLRR